MRKLDTLPSVVASKTFTDKKGKPWTKFLMSNKAEHIEQDHMSGPFMVTNSKGKDGKQHISVWSVAK